MNDMAEYALLTSVGGCSELAALAATVPGASDDMNRAKESLPEQGKALLKLPEEQPIKVLPAWVRGTRLEHAKFVDRVAESMSWTWGENITFVNIPRHSLDRAHMLL